MLTSRFAVSVIVCLGLLAACSPAPAPTQAAVAPVAGPTQIPVTPTASAIPATPTPALGIGSTSVRPTDGKTMMYVPEGEFTMGWNDGANSEKPEHKVTLDAFWIDQTEVTNTAFANCASSGPCKGASSSKDPEAGVISVPWEQAAAYCKWSDARLPTEAEWEKAARGTDGRLYPWGASEFDKTKIAQFTWENVIETAGSYPAGASPYGVLDMAGGAFEWVGDWYSSTYYSSLAVSNPAGPESGKTHVIRGGWWEWCPSYYSCQLKPTYRSTYRNGTGNYGRGGSGPSWIYYPYAGFRCARSANLPAQSSGAIPPAGSVPAASANTAVAAPPAAAPPANFQPGTVEITMGQKTTYWPRSETRIYGFYGSGGDKIDAVLTTNLACGASAPGLTTLQLKDQAGKVLADAKTKTGTQKVIQGFQLPASGPYYLYMACRGKGCNAYCIETDVLVEKN